MAERLSPELAELQQRLLKQPVPIPAPQAARPVEPQPYRPPVRADADAPRVFRSIPLGIFGLAIGIPVWLLGAHYSLTGWIIGLNLTSTMIGVGAQLVVPEPVGLARVALIVLLGLIYSAAELLGRPPRHVRWQVWLLCAGLIGLVHLTDAGSTFLSVMRPAADAWPASRWLATQPIIAALWSAALTYLPEATLILSYNLIKGIERKPRS